MALAIKEKDGTFLMHIRYPKPDQPYGAIEEITRLGIETGCRIHILHYRTKYHLDGGHPEILLGMIREANEKGADISMETLPYLSGSTYIHAILPGWVMEGGREQTLARLADPANRDRIKEEMQYLKNITVMGNGKPTRFGHVGGHPELSGRFILDIARERQQEVDDLLIDLMIESGLDINYVGNERDEDPEMVRVMMDDTMTLLMDPLYLVGSDAMPYGEYQHPRTYGCYPRMLRLARERNIPLEQMVNKITMMPARRLRLAGKGELAPGMAADIVIFDPETIADADDFDDPYKRPTGIQSVYVNGERTVENGVYNGALNGTLVHKE